MFCLDVVVVCRCVSSTDVFLWGSSWSCIDVCVLLACRYMIAFSPCMCSLYLREVLFHNHHIQDTTLLPKYKEHKQGENAFISLQANKTHTTSIQDQEELQKKYISRRETSSHYYYIQTKHKKTLYVYTFHFNDVTF
jgi:hypothetical protein